MHSIYLGTIYCYLMENILNVLIEVLIEQQVLITVVEKKIIIVKEF